MSVFLGVACFAVGWVMGHNWLFSRTSADVANMAVLRKNARWLKETKRFVGEGAVPISSSTLVIGEDRFVLKLTHAEDEGVVLEHSA